MPPAVAAPTTTTVQTAIRASRGPRRVPRSGGRLVHGGWPGGGWSTACTGGGVGGSWSVVGQGRLIPARPDVPASPASLDVGAGGTLPNAGRVVSGGIPATVGASSGGDCWPVSA